MYNIYNIQTIRYVNIDTKVYQLQIPKCEQQEWLL